MYRTSRRDFLKTTAVAAGATSLAMIHKGDKVYAAEEQKLFQQFCDPPREYTLIPFWFLND